MLASKKTAYFPFLNVYRGDKFIDGINDKSTSNVAVGMKICQFSSIAGLISPMIPIFLSSTRISAVLPSINSVECIGLSLD